MNLNDLVVDLDYQAHYSYDKRCELFNKYGISTAMGFFVPIWGLSMFIRNTCLRGYQNSKDVSFGHGQRVVDSTLIEKTRAEKYPRIKTYEHGHRIDINIYFNNIEKCEHRGSMRRIINYNIKEKTISINNYGFLDMCYVPRDLYEKIDEWLVDFGFEKW